MKTKPHPKSLFPVVFSFFSFRNRACSGHHFDSGEVSFRIKHCLGTDLRRGEVPGIR